MELAVLDEAHWELAGSCLPLPQINLHLGEFLLSCYSILLLSISHGRKRIAMEACVREDINFFVLFLWSKERGGSFRWQFREETYMDPKLPSQRPNTSALLQREVQPTKATLSLRAYGPPVLVEHTV